MIKNSKKRIFDEIVRNDLSPEELDELADKIRVVAQEKRLLSSDERIKQSIEYLDEQYDLIDPGEDWKDAKTSAAVKNLEKLAFRHIFEDILAVEENESRWKLALRVTEVLSGMIEDAESWGEQLVSGSMGSWCPNTAVQLEEFWKKFVDDKNTRRPSVPTLLNAKRRLSNCLGDYGDLNFVLVQFPAKQSSDQFEVIDLCDS